MWKQLQNSILNNEHYFKNSHFKNIDSKNISILINWYFLMSIPKI